MVTDDEDEDDEDEEDSKDEEDQPALLRTVWQGRIDDEDENEDDEEDSEDEEDHPALQYVNDPDVRTAFAAMSREGRDAFLFILQDLAL
jgi:hypothetical protein